jgi:hypothetical protein
MDTKFKKGHIPWNKKEHIEKICLGCKNKYFVPPYREKKSKYCSIPCKARCIIAGWSKGTKGVLKANKTSFKKGQSTWNKGIKGLHFSPKTEFKKGLIPWNYKGICSKNKIERNVFRQTLQKDIFERDNFTCQVCNKKGVYLHVDHIKSFSKYPNLRFVMDNCRTICRQCHYFLTFNKRLPPNNNWGMRPIILKETENAR